MALKITDEQNYQDIADAIRNKLGSTDTFLPSEMADAIENIPTGGVTSEFKTKFIDYDGTVLHEYTQEEVDALTELPPLPSHEGLICQEWNWSLADIKALGRQVIVGANYTTDNGRTRLYISIPDCDRTILCEFKETSRGGIKIYWGDGETSTPGGYSVNTSHTYDEPGDYIIEFEVLQGKLVIQGDQNYGSMICWSGDSIPYGTVGAAIYINKIELGDNVSLDQFAFKRTGADTINIPTDISYESASYGEFSRNQWLKCIVYPKGITELPAQTATENKSMKYASIPNGVTVIGILAFNECNQLKSFSFPDTVTTIENRAFVNCNHIEDITFPTTMPSLGSESFSGVAGFNNPTFLSSIHSVTEKCFYGIDIKEIILNDDTLRLVNNSLNYLTQVEKFVMRKKPYQMTTTSLGNLKAVNEVILPNDLTMLCDRMFFGNSTLETIDLPDTITTIGNDCFYNCIALKEITLPAALQTLGTEVFSGCKMVSELIIPAGVSVIPNYTCYGMTNLRAFICLGNIESIGKSNVFSSCDRISVYDFSHCTSVPTLQSSTTFKINSGTIIKVPADLLEDFKQAQYWSGYVDNMVGV